MMLQAQVSRREFLKTSAQSRRSPHSRLLFPRTRTSAGTGVRWTIKVFKPNAWLRITADNQITVLVEKPELGQGSRTYTPMMIAEELEADWSTIRVEQAPDDSCDLSGSAYRWQRRRGKYVYPDAPGRGTGARNAYSRLQPSNGERRRETAELRTAPSCTVRQTAA